MGNFWIPHFDSSSSSPCSTRPSSPAISRNNSNEGTHSGSRSAFSSSLNEVSPYCQILPITPTPRIFSFAELKAATGDFNLNTLIGGGDFGAVFKGWVDEKTFAPTKAGSGMAIAVEKLDSDGLQGRKEWQSEVNILGSLPHPNIVRLLGHCEEDKELLRVYEFIPGGSLSSARAHHLFNRIAQNTSDEGTHSGTGSAFSSRLDEVSPNGQILRIAPTLKIFSFAELKKATGNFQPDTVVGEGSFGRVFKGWIDEKTFAPTKAGSGMAIAVKKLNGFEGREEIFQSEVNILGSLSHPNIVRLLGHCKEDKELLLVYEFMPRGSLENHLFRRGSAFQTLSWSIRLKIAIGVARGLAFLHCSERKIIHRNLTPSNVLIDLNYNAKFSDFVLARNGPQGENSHVSTRVMGTYAYTAPEYLSTGWLYVKSDVYGFGVVLLEMLSGLRAIDRNRPSGQHILVEWAAPYLSDRRKVLSRVMDQRLEGQYPSEGAIQAAQLILKCLRPDPRKRPSMTEVVEALEQIQAIKHMP